MNNKEQINSKVIKLGQQVLDKIASNIDKTIICCMTGHYNNIERKRITFAFQLNLDEKQIYFELSQHKSEQESLQYSVNEILKYHLTLTVDIINNSEEKKSLRYNNNNSNTIDCVVTNLSNSDNFAAIEALFERAKKLYPLIKESESKRDFSKEKTLEFNKKILDFEFELNN